MPNNLIEQIHSMELDLTVIKGEVKIIANAVQLYGDLEKRVRALEDYKNRMIGICIAVSAIVGIGTGVIVKLI